MRFIGNVEQDTQIRAVASGTLSNGDTVVVNSDGTVSAVAGASVSQAVGSAEVFTSTNNDWDMGIAYDANAQKVVIAYVDNNNLNYGTAVVGTISGTSISFGTPVVFEAASTFYPSVTYDANAQKVVIGYRDQGNSNKGTAIVGTVSGTSISFGSATVFETGATRFIFSAYDANAQKVVFSYEDQGNSNYGTAVVGTVSGTSISFGTPVVYESAITAFPSVVYDTSNQKVVMAYRDGGNSYWGTAIVGTVSGTSISFGSPVIFESGQADWISSAYDTNNQKIVIGYSDAGNVSRGQAVVGTVSGSSISFGTPVVFGGDYTSWIAVSYDENAQKTVVSYPDYYGGQYGVLKVGTVSGTSISFDTAVTFEAAQTKSIISTYDSVSNKIVIAYRDGANSNYGTAAVFQNNSTSTNITAENFIGFADSGYLSGQNVGIDSTGSVNRSQSGLTAGQKYYVQNDGSLGTTADDPSVEAGVAISATEILVKG